MKLRTFSLLTQCLLFCLTPCIAPAGEIIDITETLRTEGVAPILSADTAQDGFPVANIFDGSIETCWKGWKIIWTSSTQAQLDEHETITYALPADYMPSQQFYVTSYSVCTKNANAGISTFKFYGSNTTENAWVLLDERSINLESGNSRFSTFHIPPSATTALHEPYRAFKLEIYDSCSWNYAGVAELKINGVLADSASAIPYQHLTIQTIPPHASSQITPTVGTYGHLPTEATSRTATAIGSFDEGENTTWMLAGYILEKSTDGGASWSEPVTNLTVAVYDYVAIDGVDERITWLYQSRAQLPNDIYVDPIQGDDENAGTVDSPFQTLDYVTSILSAGKTVHLLPGTYPIQNTLTLKNLTDLSFVKDASASPTDAVIIEPAEGLKMRLLAIENTSRISFQGITFQGAHFKSDSEDIMGGAISLLNSSDIAFTACCFNNNTIENTLNSRKAFGGAIGAYNTFLSLVDCVFENNTSRTLHTMSSGGALSVVTTSTHGGGVACTNTVFQHNLAVASYNSVLAAMGGAAFIGSATQNTFTECLFAYNDCNSGSGGFGEGTLAVSGNGGSFDNTNIDGSVLLLNCTFANNTTDCAIRSTQGTVIAENCLFYGHRSLTMSSVGVATQFNHCFYDLHHPARVSNKITWTDCVQGDAQLLSDLSVPATSPAFGYGRTVEPMDFTAQTWYVNPTGTGDGHSPESALPSLTAAMRVARDGDTIELAAGSYTPATETFPIVLENRKFFTIQGAGPDQTIFEPGAENPLVTSLFILRDCYTTTIQGFSIRGFETKNGSELKYHGLAATVQNGSRVLLRNLVVEDNTCSNSGSWIDYNGPLLNVTRTIPFKMDRCKFRYNTALMNNYCAIGGLINLGFGFGVISNCEITDNQAAANWFIRGLAMNVSCGNPNYCKWELSNCLFANNTVNTNAPFESVTPSMDALYWSSPAVTTYPNLYNCTVIGGVNQAFADGLFARNCIFQNCGTVSNNKANIFDSVIVTNDAFNAGNFALGTASYVSTMSINHGIPGNVILTDDAGFRSPDAGNYTLKRNSPAIDIGSSLPFMDAEAPDLEGLEWLPKEDLTDLRGAPRVQRFSTFPPKPDAGCYETAPDAPTQLTVR